MEQEALSGNIADEQRLAFEQMRKVMVAHRKILREIRGKLDPMNFRNISDIEVTDYQKHVNDVKNYVDDSTNSPMVLKFVKTRQKFKEVGEAAIIIFNDALDLWERFQRPGISMSDYRDGRDIYQKCLLECCTKIDELLAELRDFSG